MWSRHESIGGGLVAYAAVSKMFPAMLVLHVVATHRWRAVAAMIVGGLAATLLTLAVFGADPFLLFLRNELPRLADGTAFPQIEDPSSFGANLSIYGVTTKLRALGLHQFDPGMGRVVSRVYALLVAVLAIVTARAVPKTLDPGAERLEQVVAWLGIVNLASFASPFVGGLYGGVGTTWLLALLAARASSVWQRSCWLGAMAATVVVVWVAPSPRISPVQPAGVLALILAWQAGAVVLNAWAATPSALVIALRQLATGARALQPPARDRVVSRDAP